MLHRFEEFDNLFLDEIDRYLIEGWRNKRLTTGNKNATIKRLVGVLRSVLSKAEEWGFLKHHPLTGMRKLSEDRGRTPRTLSEEDRGKLLKAPADRDSKLADERRSANRWREELSTKATADRSPALMHDMS
ncbi:MAG: hypothetical protein VW268_11995 [Rhodospirillaceae bacterium]